MTSRFTCGNAIFSSSLTACMWKDDIVRLLQASLAVMRSPWEMTPEELTLPRTKREAPRLWKD
eukprot:scaffold359274_cov20-Prasinocladus_malaysianus.AAC.1